MFPANPKKKKVSDSAGAYRGDLGCFRWSPGLRWSSTVAPQASPQASPQAPQLFEEPPPPAPRSPCASRSPLEVPGTRSCRSPETVPKRLRTSKIHAWKAIIIEKVIENQWTSAFHLVLELATSQELTTLQEVMAVPGFSIQAASGPNDRASSK